MTLDRARTEQFYDDGFLVLPRVFSREEITTLRAAFRRLADTARKLDGTGLHRGAQFVLGDRPAGTSARPIERIVWCGAAEPVLGRIALDRRVLEPVSGLLGSRRMNQLINQAHFKLPGDGVAFPWHQDSTHRRYGSEWTDVNGRGSYVQTLLAIDDVTALNGPIRFIRGSGKLGHLDIAADGTLPQGPLEEMQIVTPELEAGSVLLFGPYTVHASDPNRSPWPRRVLLNGYACPGANRRVYPGEGAGRLVVLPAGGGHGFVSGDGSAQGRVAS